MTRSNDLERICRELRWRAVTQFGEDVTRKTESCLRIAAEEIFDVDDAAVDPDLEPLNQE